MCVIKSIALLQRFCGHSVDGYANRDLVKKFRSQARRGKIDSFQLLDYTDG